MIKFQYNKTSLQSLDKDLKSRTKILPVLKSKEAALRMEVSKIKDANKVLETKIEETYISYEEISGLWNEFDKDIISIRDVELDIKKIAGVKIPLLKEVIYYIKPISLFNNPSWFLDGIEILKEISNLIIEKEVKNRQMELLDYTRKKTSQKVNLYEKVQIPGIENAILKIKRFLEDEDNLSKSAQKIVKKRKTMNQSL